MFYASIEHKTGYDTHPEVVSEHWERLVKIRQKRVRTAKTILFRDINF
jgi:archaellum biogenesis protein FlaJ (TadC family)